MRWIVVLSLLGLSTATAEAPPNSSCANMAPIEYPLFGPAIVDADKVLSDGTYAVRTFDGYANRVVFLPEAERVELQKAVKVLMTNCPWNRSRFMLPLALERSLDEINSFAMPDAPRQRLELLRDGVRAHARFMRTLNVDQLPMPEPGDFLATVEVELVDGTAFAASEDPLADVLALSMQVDGVVSQMDSTVHARLDGGRAVFDDFLHEPGAMWSANRRWYDEALRIRKGLPENNRPPQLEAVIRVLDAYTQTGC